jgi:xylulokinase
MSLLGLDVGTTGCKAALFRQDGTVLGTAYEEYDYRAPQPGYAELDAPLCGTGSRPDPRRCRSGRNDPVSALAIASMGEAVVPVTRDRHILGPSILNFDERGWNTCQHWALPSARTPVCPQQQHPGQPLQPDQAMWIRDHQPELYERADFFCIGAVCGLHAGAEPAWTTRSPIARCCSTWSVMIGHRLLAIAGLDADRLPPTVLRDAHQSVPPTLAAGTDLPPGVSIVSSAHDQCANGVGCGVLEEGQAMYGMGTFICLTPSLLAASPAVMIEALPHRAPRRARPVREFIYNQGGSIVNGSGIPSLRREKLRRFQWADLYADRSPKPQARAGCRVATLCGNRPSALYPIRAG